MTDITPSEVEQATQGRYEVLSLLGEGGMGTVFLARHRELGSRVAIKILPPDVRFRPDRLARFRREASISAQMSHPHLVPTFECSVQGDIAYLIMPYVDGVPLDRYLDEHGRMSWDEVKRLITEIGSALTFAHNRGIVHRDIKPGNILFEKETGRWLLTDFGVAHVSEETTTLTHSGASLGTPAYMAPEQLGGAAEVDARADLYSLATVAIEALAGERPEPMTGWTEISDAVSAQRPDLPTGAARALAAPLAVARDERPDSIEEWLGTLARQTRRPRWHLGAAAAVALLVAWGGWAVFRGGATPNADATPVVAVLPFAVSGTVPGINLDSLLPHAFTWQLRTLPGHVVLQPSAVRSQVVRRFGAGPFTVDSLFTIAGAVRADQALVGEVTADDRAVTIHIQLYDTARRQIIGGAEASRPADSLHALVSSLVIDVFATRLVREQTGVPAPSLPRGVPAVAAFLDGYLALRRAQYDRAIQHFDEVIELDRSYGPAYWERMLATVLAAQPSKAGEAVRSALQEALDVRTGLDAVTDDILTAYKTLLVDGDIRSAERQLRGVVDAHPDAIDAWFLLGFLRGWFAPFLGTDYSAARGALQQAVNRDPSFAAAIAYLAQVALLQDDLDAVREYMRQYLAVDSVSQWAELLRMGDTLLFHKDQALRVLRSFPNRADRILEYLSLGAAAVSQPGGTRPYAIAALEELADRATTPDELVTTFRTRMAVHVGAWQIRDARRVLQEASVRGVPPSEIDRWIVLIDACDLDGSLRLGDAAAAAQRLLRSDDDDVVSAWLAARWARRSGVSVAPFDARFAASTSGDESSPLQQSLRDDLRALDYLTEGDTAQALDTWEGALTHVSVTEVLFGLVASLWPLRLDRARVALASGRGDVATAAAESFLQIGGFIDQVAWVPALLTAADAHLARGDTIGAAPRYDELRRLLVLADDAGQALRDSLTAVARGVGR